MYISTYIHLHIASFCTDSPGVQFSRLPDGEAPRPWGYVCHKSLKLNSMCISICIYHMIFIFIHIHIYIYIIYEHIVCNIM